MTEHSCDLCNSSDSVPLDKDISVCKNCGFLYVRERRSARKVADSWDDIFGDGYSSSWPAVKSRLYYVAEWYDQNFGWKGKSVLDIGAGEGTFMEMVRSRGAYTVGLEPGAENCAAITEKDMYVHKGIVEDFPLLGQFDIVTINWTLENCTDCIGMLKFAKRHIHDQGHVLVATGSRILVPYKKPLSMYLSDNPPDTHCFRFSSNTLEACMKKAGLVPSGENSDIDCDWLVRVGRPGEAEIVFPVDNHWEVTAYFENWAEQWP